MARPTYIVARNAQRADLHDKIRSRKHDVSSPPTVTIVCSVDYEAIRDRIRRLVKSAAVRPTRSIAHVESNCVIDLLPNVHNLQVAPLFLLGILHDPRRSWRIFCVCLMSFPL
ncbi:unnamed protein product, partial [Heterotrigona itama]